MKNLRRLVAGFGVFSVLFGNVGWFGQVVQAAVPGSVVINEVAWAGSVNSANDEWIELYNSSSSAVDLADWKLKDDGALAFTFPASASIPAHGYFLIEDSENAVSSIQSDAIYNMSLANSGDSLQLLDSNDQIIDTVNGSGGAWYAGSSTTYASMERKVAGDGDISANFAASTGSGATASAGGAIVGTPKLVNSVSGGSGGGTQTFTGVKADVAKTTFAPGEEVLLTVKVGDIADLFAYGLELNFDSTKLDYLSTVPGNYLSDTGAVPTSFQSGLKAGQNGVLLLAEARTQANKTGKTGSGDLLVVKFKVKDAVTGSANFSFGTASFLSSPTADIVTSFAPVSFTVGQTAPAVVSGLVAGEGTGRYMIKLQWGAVAGADTYIIERKNALGVWVKLGEVTALEFVDQDTVVSGGKIIPQMDYSYRVSAKKAALVGPTVEVVGRDARGLKGDSNRSDLVDGRDLERLAKLFGAVVADSGFDPLIDTTYDGVINGSDLIDLGANFAKKY